MSDPFVGELRLFAGNFAPVGWAFCNGALLPIAQYDVLFSLLGTTYGGDGQTTFAVPDLRGRVPVHQGTGVGLTPYALGQIGGVEQVTLTSVQLPAHSHSLLATGVAGDASAATASSVPASMGPAGTDSVNTYIAYNGTTQVALNGNSVTPAGQSQPHANLQPTLVVNYIIATEGIYPSRP